MPSQTLPVIALQSASRVTIVFIVRHQTEQLRLETNAQVPSNTVVGANFRDKRLQHEIAKSCQFDEQADLYALS